MLEIADNVRVKVLKGMIADVVARPGAASADAKDEKKEKKGEAEYYRALGDAEEQVVNLKMTPAQALAEADSIVQQALDVAITEHNYGD